MPPKRFLKNKYGCPECARMSSIGHPAYISENTGKRMTKDQFLDAAYKKFGDKFTFEKIDWVSGVKPVILTCKKHGDFIKTPQNFLYSTHGCPKCRNEQVNSKLHSRSKIADKNQFTKLAKEAHGNRYDYSKVEIKDTGTKVCITCPEHGDFWQLPYLHLRGEGCPECKREGIFNCERRIGDLLVQRFPNLEFIHDKTQE